MSTLTSSVKGGEYCNDANRTTSPRAEENLETFPHLVKLGELEDLLSFGREQLLESREICILGLRLAMGEF